jgi:SAM-dependent methyltransferase
MARAVAPGEIIGVDYSAGMLAAARERANAAGLSLSLVHAKAEDFLDSCAPESLDVVSCRFMLAYVDFEKVVPSMGRVVRRGGRVAVLTSLSSTIPQAHQLYSMFMESFGAAASEMESPVPDTEENVVQLLEKGGLRAVDSWTERIRLWFDNGMQAAHWMRESGYATHPSLGPVSPEALQSLEQLFAAGMEASFREPQGIPLDLVISGAIAEKS